MKISLIQSHELVPAIEEVIQGWNFVQPPSWDWGVVSHCLDLKSNSLENRLKTLCLINCYQWSLEDECRLNYERLSIVGKLKKLIDDSNSRRVSMINHIDLELFKNIGRDHSSLSSIRPIGESLGNIYDRLIVMHIRLQNFKQGDPNKNTALLNEQIRDTLTYLDETILDLLSHNRVLKTYQIEKSYKNRDE